MWLGIGRYGKVCYWMVFYAEACHGEVSYGAAWHSMVWYNVRYIICIGRRALVL